MSADELEEYLRALGLSVARATDSNGLAYTAALGVQITTGGLRGTRCDVALQRVETNPYVAPAAIHTRPALVAMDMNEPLRTQVSPLRVLSGSTGAVASTIRRRHNGSGLTS